MKTILDEINKIQEREKVLNNIHEPIINCINTYKTANNECFSYSDHLPVVRKIKIDGIDVKFASFNVLYQDYLNKQKGPGQHISTYYHHLTNMKISDRQKGIIDIIENLFDKHNIDILGLQEFDNTLKNNITLPFVNYIDLQYIPGFGKNPTNKLSITDDTTDWQAVFYNNKKIDFNQPKSHLTYYYEKGNIKINKRIVNISFSLKNNPDNEFRFINTHTQFNDWQRLTDYVNNIKKPKNYKKPYYIIVVGDMNTTDNLVNLYDTELPEMYVQNKLVKLSYSHVDTKGNPVLYDHIIYKTL